MVAPSWVLVCRPEVLFASSLKEEGTSVMGPIWSENSNFESLITLRISEFWQHMRGLTPSESLVEHV